jgi:enoyl-CoA hydratase
VNAFDSKEWAQLAELFTRLGRDESVHVVLVAAEGRGFCAGVDIKELAAESTVITKVNKGCYDTFAAIHDCPVPVIAAAHGFVLGGGIGIVGSCDVIFASEDATFGLPEIDRGALGAASHLLRMFPIQKVRRMLYSGEPISAQEAYRLGALEAVVKREELRDVARELAGKIAEKSPKAVRLAKESLNGIELLDVKRSYRFEQGFTLELYTSPDSQEARDAFVEKRDASFEGGKGGKD